MHPPNQIILQNSTVIYNNQFWRPTKRQNYGKISSMCSNIRVSRPLHPILHISVIKILWLILQGHFCGKFGSMPTFKSMQKGKKCFFFCDGPTSVWAQGVTQHHIFKFFFDFTRIFSLFSLVFRTSNFWTSKNLIKQLFHSHLMDTRLVIAKLTPRPSLAIYHLISNARSWNDC